MICKKKTNKKLTTEEVRKFIESFGYKLLSEYKDSKTKILVSCPNEEHEPYYVQWGNFYMGKRCPKCKTEKLNRHFKKSTEEVKEFIESKGLKWVNGEYKNYKSRLIIECSHGHQYEACYGTIHNGYGCPYCNGNAKLSYEYVKKEIEKYGYKLLSKEYKNAITPLLIECSHGHQYWVTWNKFQQKRRCPKCNSSTPEQIIFEWLDLHKILYVKEKIFKDCKDERYLPFDFYLPNYNICIEYDGEQHYKDVSFRGNKTKLEYIQKHDSIKTKFCIDNNIKLIRIPYWEFKNIEDILAKEIN